MENSAEHYKITIALLLLIITGMFLYYEVWTQPDNTIDMYYLLNNPDFTNQIDDALIPPPESSITGDVRERITGTTASRLRQFSVIEHAGPIETIVIETTPGTRKLEIPGVYAASDEITRYLKSLD